VIEDAPHHARIVDQGDHAHWAAVITSAFWTYERIGFVDLANKPRPGGLGAGGELAHVFDVCWGLGHGVLRLERLRAFTARAVRVPADIAHQMLVAIGDVFAEQLQPLGPGHQKKQGRLREFNDGLAEFRKRHPAFAIPESIAPPKYSG